MKQTLREWMAEGPYTLALSSAFFGFYAHCGAVESLFSAGYLPTKITGSSAGALVGGALASGLDPVAARDLVFSVRKEDFWDPFPGLGFLRGRKFRQKIETHFARSFTEMKIPFAVSVFDVLTMKTRFLDQGLVAPAVVASCSVPLMFHPVWIGGRPTWDGGIRNKSGIHPRDERVLCVYLESAGAAGLYERRTSFRDLKTGHKVLRFTQFPRVGPETLARGRDAHINILERTRCALDVPFVGHFLDA